MLPYTDITNQKTENHEYYQSSYKLREKKGRKTCEVSLPECLQQTENVSVKTAKLGIFFNTHNKNKI